MSIPSNCFIYINVFIGLIYLTFIIIGYKKGLLFEIISLVYTGVSLVIAWFLAPVFSGMFPIVILSNMNVEAQLVSKLINIDAISNTVIYFVAIFFLLRLFYFLISLLLKGMNKLPVIGKFNKILGGLFGIVNATLVTIMFSMLLNLPLFDNAQEVRNNTLFKYISEYSDVALNYVVDNVDLDGIKAKFDSVDVDKARDDFKAWLELNK